MTREFADNRGLFDAIVADGRPLILFTGLSLLLSGAFALFLAASGNFLPHDIAFLGMVPEELCSINECRVVHFMIHDRVSFGGALIAIGALYMWLAEFPLRARQPWAWWTLAVSGMVGFASFLAYLGYGYLDTWHGLATMALLPCFILGMARSFVELAQPRGPLALTKASTPLTWNTAQGLGRVFLLATSVGLIAGGLTIMTVGMTTVFVPSDLEFIGLDYASVSAINPRLVPLIAHDRAGFGGGVCTCGITILLSVWCGAASRSLWQALTIAGFAGFSTAILVHPVVGYNDALHLAPAVAGATMFAIGLWLSYRPMMKAGRAAVEPSRTVAAA
jgi:hypothetical protein